MINKILQNLINILIKSRKCFFENWRDIIPVLLTVILVWQGINQHELSREIASRENRVLLGQKYEFVSNTKDFSIEYLNNCIKYLVYEHRKVLKTDLKSVDSLSRQDYVDWQPLYRSLESYFLLGFVPKVDDQDSIEIYFRNFSRLESPRGNILEPRQIELFKKLKSSIIECNNELNRVAPRLKNGEQFWVKAYFEERQ